MISYPLHFRRVGSDGVVKMVVGSISVPEGVTAHDCKVIAGTLELIKLQVSTDD